MIAPVSVLETSLVRAVDRPRLLVSVRNAGEAAKAIAGGAEVLDVKEPLRGSLGRANAASLDAVAMSISATETRPPLSVALGELREWDDLAAVRLPKEVALAKIGLAEMRNQARWSENWQRTRKAIESATGRGLNWVAVAYADEDAAEAPPLDAVLQAAVTSGCRGLLVDTFDKRGPRLLELVDLERLSRLAEELHREGLFLAVAGRLRTPDLVRLRESPCDLVAVRSAACLGDARTQEISRHRVTLCRQALEATSPAFRNAC